MTQASNPFAVEDLQQEPVRASSFVWSAIVVGALAMTATYPSRSHGLGMVTEPLLQDFGLATDDGRVLFASLNFWASILGAPFCFPVGWLLDRVGQRWVLGGNLVLLGLAVWLMSNCHGVAWLFIGLLLTRGLGQSALSVVSITIVSNAHDKKRLSMAMAFYALITMPMHIVLIGFVGWGLETAKWHWALLWDVIGAVLVLFSLAALMIPGSRRMTSSKNEVGMDAMANAESPESFDLWQALRTPAFWLFGLTIAVWGMTYAGISLFNEAIFSERGFPPALYYQILGYMTLITLVSTMLFGWLANRVRLTSLLAWALALTALSLAALPFASQTWHAYVYGTFLGVAAGAISLLFFTVWGKVFGPVALGQIQGVAQMLSVFASACGPLVFSVGKKYSGSYMNVFLLLAAVMALMAILSLVTPMPRLREAECS